MELNFFVHGPGRSASFWWPGQADAKNPQLLISSQIFCENLELQTYTMVKLPPNNCCTKWRILRFRILLWLLKSCLRFLLKLRITMDWSTYSTNLSTGRTTHMRLDDIVVQRP